VTAEPEMPGSDAYRTRAFGALEAGDHHTAYRWAKGWIGAGGAEHPEPWLVYVAESLMGRRPKGAVHAVDLALRHWVTGHHDRHGLTWLRGCIVRDRLGDPRTALLDLREAAAGLPGWVTDDPLTAVAECEDLAERSRKRVPSVGPAAEYAGPRATQVDGTPTARPREWSHEAHVDGDPPDERLRRVLADLGLPVLRT
jgi:hypothetical protein